MTLLVCSCSASTKLGETGSTASSQTKLISNAYQLTFEGARSGEGYFSPDGNKLIFQSEREPNNPFYQMYVTELSSGLTKRVSSGKGKSTCGWFKPNGDQILFSSTHHDPRSTEQQKAELEFRASGKEKRYSWDYDPSYEIYTRDLKSNKLKRITNSKGYDAEASWSPSGEKILFASNRHAFVEKLTAEEKALLEKDPSAFVELYLMNSDGSQVQRLTHNKVYDGGPFFGNSDAKIIWRRFSPDSTTAEIFTGELVSSASTKKRIEPVQLSEKQCTDLKAMSWAPFYHPSADYFIFTTNLHGFDNFELYISRSDCSKISRATELPGFDGLPSFSPDGSILSWTAKRGAVAKSQIFFADWDDTAARDALGLPAVESKPKHPASGSSFIDPTQTKRWLLELTSDRMQGRMTGTEGEINATEYAATELTRLGFEPLTGESSMFMDFEFSAGIALGVGNRAEIHSSVPQGANQADQAQQSTAIQSLEVEKDWLPLPFSTSSHSSAAIAPAEVVFAGYGIRAPEFISPTGQKYDEYDSFVHLDVKDKYVIAFRGSPLDLQVDWRKHLDRFSSLRYKAMVARTLGAKGVIFVSGPLSQIRNQLIPLSFDASEADSGIVAISLTDSSAEKLIANSKHTLRELQDKLKAGSPMQGFLIPETKLNLEVRVSQQKKTGRNVVARLKGTQGNKLKPVIIGAHIDHLGIGASSHSLAREGEKNLVHVGADDNASGVAAILAIAKHTAELSKHAKLKRDLIVGLWSGEELGLLGSSNFMTNFETKNKSQAFAAYLNLDMVGRSKENQLILQGIGSGDNWSTKIESANIPVGLSITTQQDSYLPTDATTFYLAGIPILSGFTGVHEDYHSPRDTPEKINYQGLNNIAEFFARLTVDLLTSETSPNYLKQEKPANFGQKASLRAYLGSIPDYSSGDTKGVKLSGVTAGAPADKAGVQRGDIIVELGGKKVENIYDYTFAIEALEIGKQVEIVVIRGDQTLRLSIIPASRE